MDHGCAGELRGPASNRDTMIEKTLRRSGEMEFAEPAAWLLDGLAYAMRDEARAGGPTAPFLEEIVSALRADELHLPILSDSVSKVMQLINQPEVDVGELALLVELDPTLAVKTVGVANSAYYRGVEPAVSVRGALMRMGLHHARNVVATVALRSSLFRVSGYEKRAQIVWFHSLLTAFATQVLLREAPPWQDAGFLLGLTHDVGRIAILGFAAELHSRRPKRSGLHPTVIEEVSDLFHARLGALAVDSWGFSREFAEVIASHHHPETIKDHRIVLAHALAAGDALASRIESGWSAEGGEMGEELLERLSCVGVDESDGMELAREVYSDFEAFAKLV